MTITDLKSALEYAQRKLGSLALKDSFNIEGKTTLESFNTVQHRMDDEIEKWSLICQDLQAKLEEAIIQNFYPQKADI